MDMLKITKETLKQKEREIDALWKEIDKEASKAPCAREAQKLGAMVREATRLENELLELAEMMEGRYDKNRLRKTY